jgi:enamine deaminase RidA (YjgF/YER057c/UK114 family)
MLSSLPTDGNIWGRAMNKAINPKTVAPPLGAYSHAIEVPANARYLHIAGQVGMRPDGTLAEGAEAQCDQIWRNIVAILEAGGMSVRDLVRINSFLTRPEDIPVARTVRAKYLDGHEPASTLLVVARLAGPELLMEIEAVAAKA